MDKLHTFRCIITTRVGETNKKKFDAISKKLKGKYSIVGASPDFSNMLFKSNTGIITINQQQIVLAVQNGNVTEDDIKAVKEDTEKIFEILLLDDNVSASYDFIINKSVNNDYMESSKNLMSDKVKSVAGIEGFGIRAFYKYKNQLSEIRVEPLLSDHNIIYIESLINCKNIAYKNIDKEGIEAYNYFKERYEELIAKII